ncbi:hypothetical protein [Novosphingobium cyanobacteriorum]|uniref:Uncharacterized protein n=1 Tax=Novosphingobium cyanobacteriorum TaxID=3024215 RepID=A0ABT6CGE3_9SPHN|nr:hypothetical protein [Novosphingobium cyanobacteriorum]MDF8332999.1 hypothetical protein [Novosphingobium cyanobacteriorum]
MSVQVPPRENAFPKPAAPTPRANAWGSQWKHLPRSPRAMMRNAMRDGLRVIRLG